MKKNNTTGNILTGKIPPKHFLLIMRTVFILLFTCVFCSMAEMSYTQNAKVTIHKHDVTLREVLTEIESQTDYLFIYNNEVNVNEKVSISAEQQTVSNVLASLLNDRGVSYSMEGNHIILSTIIQSLEITETPSTSVAQQQGKTITGTVTDQTGMPLPGVTIVVKGTNTGTITRSDGNYNLSNVQPSTTLVFSFVGMQTQEIVVGNQTSINVTLQEEAIGLEEIVAIGYGTAKKSDLTGAVASIVGESVSERKTIQVSQALQGTMPGLMVTRNSGAPDASATIRVRGITTLSDNNPLIIVDGIAGTLDWINPNDIESISVLKDAASASIYGSRAAAGVILVTTKRAKSGQLALNYNYDFGIDKPITLPDYADVITYMNVLNEINWNDAGNMPGYEFPVYSEDLIKNYSSLHRENPDKYPNTDWQDLILKKFSTRQSHQLILTAGSEKIQSKISLDYNINDALYEGRSYDRVMVRANNDIIINDILSVAIDFNGIHSINKNPRYDFENGFGVAPVYPALWSDGRIAIGKSGSNIYAASKYGGFKEAKAYSYGGKISVAFSPLKRLKLTGVFSPQFYDNKKKDFIKQLTYTNYDDPEKVLGYIEYCASTSLTETRTDNYNLTAQLIANYEIDFGKNSVNIMGGYENYYYRNETLGASRDNYVLSTFPYLDQGNENYQFNHGSAFEYAYRSFFGRIMHNYQRKYYFQANVRYDGSSRFYSDYRWGLFPSFSAGWVMSEESFMSQIKWLSFLKLRASWGTLGNERIGSYYPYQSTIGFGSSIMYQGDNVVSAPTASVSQYAIKDISWETTESYNIGLDVNLFKNKLTITGDYYRKETKDMLLELEIPNYIGLDNPSQNAGKMFTKGVEFEFKWNDQVGDLNYSISVNLSDSKTIMGDLGGTVFLGSKIKRQGSEYDEWYGYLSDGLFQTDEEVANSATLSKNVKPGDVKYLDLSGPKGIPDGIISSEYDRVLLGGSLPRYLYGGNIRLGYKNFDFSLVLQGVGKQKALLTSAMIEPLRMAYMDVPQLIVGNYWSKYNTKEQNLNVRYPRVSFTGKTNNYSFSDYWLFNGAYLRIKNITLGYNLPISQLKQRFIKNVRIYSSISDLFSIDKYPKGWDPESPSSSSSTMSTESSNYWFTTSYVFGISLQF